MSLAIDYATATARQLIEALTRREVSSTELLEAAIRRIEAMDGAINAVVVRDFDRARAAAAEADKALARGERAPLLGLPMTVKESYAVAGLPTTHGFEPPKGGVMSRDAAAIERLKAAGAVIMGKTNVPPSLSDWQSDNPVYGRTNNPQDLSRSPGGSSGGSAAAVAAGFTALELGSDIGGSIRVPAAFCGVYGHKPTYGLIPMRGHALPETEHLSASPLSAGGPLARSADDLQLAMDVLAGPDREEAIAWRLELPPPRGRKLADYRVLILDNHPLATVDGEILAALERVAGAIEDAGAKVERTSPLLPDLAPAHRTYVDILTTVMSRRSGNPRMISAQAYLDAVDDQLAFRRAWAALFEAFDVVLAPTLGIVAFPHTSEPDWKKRTATINGEPASFGAQIAWAGMAILAHLPATAVPIGRTRDGLPIGMQVMGPYLEDGTPIGFAALLQQAGLA